MLKFSTTPPIERHDIDHTHVVQRSINPWRISRIIRLAGAMRPRECNLQRLQRNKKHGTHNIYLGINDESFVRVFMIQKK